MGVHRHLNGQADEIQVTIRETVTVKPGDLIFINDTADDVTNKLGGASAAADNYGYPWAAGREAGDTNVNKGYSSFIGVALDDSAQATTTISVATRGVFRFPLNNKGAVTVGATVHGQKPSGFSASSSTTASYEVQTGASYATIGYCVKTESGASNVDFRIRTLLGDGLA